MLKQRVITALIGLPIVAAILFSGSHHILGLLFLVLVGLGSFEMSQLMLPRLEALFSGADQERIGVDSSKHFTLGCVAILTFALVIFNPTESGQGYLIGLFFLLLIAASFFSDTNEIAVARALGYVMTIVYGMFPWLVVWQLLLMDGASPKFVILLITIVWAGDTAAYFGGRAFGKHKLAPRMSPKKTWEGAVCGLVASIVGGLLVNLGWAGSLAPWYVIGMCGLIGGVFGQMGDLVESTFKRFAGQKDSGSIFPGHGGFLDRVDGLIFAAPAIWFILHNFS